MTNMPMPSVDDIAPRRDLRIEYRDIDALKPWPKNARTHSRKQIDQIADSMRTFGWTNPILTDEGDGIIAGHGRLEAARKLGFRCVPTIRLANLTEAQKRAYILADNKLAENAGWDTEILAIELQHLVDLDLDFDVTVTGFDVAEIDLLIEGLGDDEDEAADELPDEPEDGTIASRVGDLWLLGDHRLLCADATERDSFARLMDGDKAAMIFTDPPYNVAIDGHVTGSGAIKHAEFVMASGEMSEGEFTAFLTAALRNLAIFSRDGSIHYVCMDWRPMMELLTAGRAVYAELKNLCVWNKDNGGMGSFYRSKHELVFVFKSGTAPHVNNFGLGEGGRYRTNVWDYRGVNTLKPDRLEELAMHPTVKPAAMVADAIRDCSRHGDLVLDAFAGSGTTIIASEMTRRRARTLELDPRHVDTAVRRWQAYTGERARLSETGDAFDDVAAERLD